MSDYKEFLDIAVFQENKPVTYKFLARSLGIHVKNAKQALHEFSTSQNNVYAIYCITGIKLSSGEFNIQLIKEDELEATKKKYKSISSTYVYSVASYDLDDFSILYTATKDIPKIPLEDRIKCGVLRNANVQYKSLSAKGSKPPPPSPALNVPISKQPMIATNSATKRKGITPIEAPFPKKVAVEKPVKNTIKSDSKKTKKSSPAAKPVPKKKTDDETRMAKTSLKMEDIFSDDEKDDDKPQSPSPQEEEEDIIMMEADEDIEKAKQPSKEPEDDLQDTPVEPGKIRRKVLKKKTTTNARGHLVTEETWEWETVDASEEAPNKPVTPKSTATKTISTSNKKSIAQPKKKNQASILNFFGKKP
ncbi:hypothetical protein G6F37_007413 [Rhizopus arrhizus]|nr:hypothetical protein G6F38_006703 [Rhizopus arrhizus]KAG1156656.1 hypothetical protein G6F37_007413 [Rhizopus arrhizus]